MAFLPLLAVLLASGPAAGHTASADEPDDPTLLRAWEGLARKKRDKDRVVKAFRARVDALDTFQLDLVRELCEAAGKPGKPKKAPFFDPKEHVRNQPVQRKPLDQDDERYVAWVAHLERDRDPRTLRAAHRYDWYEREVVRFGDPDDPDLVFENALHGYPPGLDLARAQALSLLDRGQAEELLRAFAHSYTDREGGVFPGVTLYDVWISGSTMEMPDVDALGLIHTLLDDWTTWTDPVPGERHDSLYAQIGELFSVARDYREPRESLVDNLLIADPVPRTGYESLHGNFQALWAKHDSDASALAAEFPDGQGWRPWIEAWVKVCKSDQAVWDAGVQRQERLAQSASAVRSALVAAMREAGVLQGG